MNLIFSRRLALAIGVALPLGETLRLWGGGPIAWGLDHYLMGAFLLYGAGGAVVMISQARATAYEGEGYPNAIKNRPLRSSWRRQIRRYKAR